MVEAFTTSLRGTQCVQSSVKHIILHYSKLVDFDQFRILTSQNLWVMIIGSLCCALFDKLRYQHLVIFGG